MNAVRKYSQNLRHQFQNVQKKSKIISFSIVYFQVNDAMFPNADKPWSDALCGA